MRRLVWTTLAMLAVSSRPADSHQLDEYLQATRIAAAAHRVTVEMSLTPGVAVVARVFALIDRDGDGRASSAEIGRYARRVLRDVVVSVDGQPVQMTITRAECPPWEEIRAGAGTIRVEAAATVRAMSAGRHQIRLVNAHEPGISAYLVNALVPSDAGITIAAQRRDVLQHGIELDVDVAQRYTTALWSIVIFGAFAALATHRVSRSWRASDRSASIHSIGAFSPAVPTGAKRPYDSSRAKNASTASAVTPRTIDTAIAIAGKDGPSRVTG